MITASDVSKKPGAVHLDLAGGPHVDRSIEDRVLEWDEGRRYLLDSSGMRVMKYVRNEWSVAPDGEGSSVTVTFDFAAKFGVLGALAERLMMRRAVRNWVRLILAGLKHHIETGRGSRLVASGRCYGRRLNGVTRRMAHAAPRATPAGGLLC